MTEKKLIDARSATFSATSIMLSDDPDSREYLIRDSEGDSIIQCHSGIQLRATVRALNLRSENTGLRLRW